MLIDILSWLFTIFVTLSILFCGYFVFCWPPRNHCGWFRRWILRTSYRYDLYRRRRSNSSHFPPIHLVAASIPIEHFAALKLLTDGRVPSDCAVCLDPFADDHQMLRFIPKCHHAFHVSCLDPWLEAHNTCPTCRATLVQLAPESTRNDIVLEVAAEGAVGRVLEEEVTSPVEHPSLPRLLQLDVDVL